MSPSNDEAEFLNILSNIRRLRKNTKSLSLEQLNVALSKLSTIIAEKEDSEKKSALALKEKQDKLDQIHKLQAQLGLTDQDIIDAANPVVEQPKKKPLKYLHIDDSGKEHRWSGRSNAPKVFKELIEKGVDIDVECLVRNQK